MLYTQNVDLKLLQLLHAIMQSKTFKDFNLVGGTSLALQIGHRISVDIDMFGISEINELGFNQELDRLGKITVLKKSKNIIVYAIDEIKVDFVNYNYPLLKPIKVVEGIRLISMEDIAAMKLNAISGRGSKKDFIDLFYLLNIFSLETMFEFYVNKYHDGSIFLALKSLTYFDDADIDEMPVMTEKVEWNNIKNTILKEAKKLS